jgi:hypothetical protein
MRYCQIIRVKSHNSRRCRRAGQTHPHSFQPFTRGNHTKLDSRCYLPTSMQPE